VQKEFLAVLNGTGALHIAIDPDLLGFALSSQAVWHTENARVMLTSVNRLPPLVRACGPELGCYWLHSHSGLQRTQEDRTDIDLGSSRPEQSTGNYAMRRELNRKLSAQVSRLQDQVWRNAGQDRTRAFTKRTVRLDEVVSYALATVEANWFHGEAEC